jgi:predicted nucleotidyltransferase
MFEHVSVGQVLDDAAFADAIASAEIYLLEGHKLRVINCKELVGAKLRAALDPARRKSKRMQDLADVQGLLEQYPDLERLFSAAERARLG